MHHMRRERPKDKEAAGHKARRKQQQREEDDDDAAPLARAHAGEPLSPLPATELPQLPKGSRYMRMEEHCMVYDKDQDGEEQKRE